MSSQLLTFLYPALLAAVILTGIHTYLGLHVVERGTIFADLALAQVAALGTAVAYLAAEPEAGPAVTWLCSLGFTIAAAAVFAFTPLRRTGRIPREAIFGIVYVVSAAAAILVMSQVAEGSEHLEDLLVGNILTVSKHMVAQTAALYAGVGLFHWIFRRKFLAISAGGAASVPNAKWWDFLFYASFGAAVASSVAIAGVLLVFAYLVVPPVAAMLFSQSLGKRLAIGWTIGAVVSAAGILISFEADLPTGATIVCTFGLALLLLAGVRSQVTKAGHR